MITTTREFVKRLLERIPKGKVLEVGSLDVNGNIRDLFGGWEYIGVDMRDGKNVDKIVNGHDLLKEFEPESFDLVVCIDTLEHDVRFWETIENMRGVLKTGGYLVVCVPSLRHPRHNHPNDYYRFFETFLGEVALEGYDDLCINIDCYSDNNTNLPDEVLGWGRKC